MSGGILQRKPALRPHLSDLYEDFYEIDRDGMSGSLTFHGMNDMLDEHGITDRQERKAVRLVWKQMEAARLEMKREADKRKGTDLG
jgi:hypothetical protein